MRSVTTVTNKTWNPSFIPKRASEAQASQVFSVIFYFLFLTAFSLFFLPLSFFLPLLPPSLPPFLRSLPRVWYSWSVSEHIIGHLWNTPRENAGDRRCPENVQTIWLHKRSPSFSLFSSFLLFHVRPNGADFLSHPLALIFSHFSQPPLPQSSNLTARNGTSNR